MNRLPFLSFLEMLTNFQKFEVLLVKWIKEAM